MNIEDRAILRDRYANHFPTLLRLTILWLAGIGLLWLVGWWRS